MICICCNTRFTYPDPCPSCGFVAAASTETGDYPPGTRIAGRYTINRPLGTGRFGSCFCAHDDRFNVDVAIKFIHPGYLPEPPFVEKFISGMRFLQQNNYPVTTAMVDVGVHDTCAYVASELLEGVTLRDLIAKRALVGRLFSVAEVFPVIRQLAAYLIESDAGPHGALCPENIWILPGNLKVTDPGLVENLPAGVLEIRILASAVTSPYVAPELRSGKGLSAASDVFSLGVLIGEMLSGHLYTGRLESYLSRGGLTLAPVEDLLRRALGDAPQSRFNDAEALTLLLARAAHQEPPVFVRPWGAVHPPAADDTDAPEVEKTQQIPMDEIISQHYREVTSVGRNPLASPAPRPAAPRVPHREIEPSRPPRSTLNPVVPPPPKRPAPAVRPAILPPGPPASKFPAHAHEGMRHGMVNLDDDELGDMLPIDELSGLIEVPVEGEPATAETAVEKLEQQAAEAATTSTDELLRRARSLDGVDPRFIRAAHRLETERISQVAKQSAAMVREHQKDLAGIDPRLIRAAAKLEQARIADVPIREGSNARAIPPSESPDINERTDDDWRSRIEAESCANPDSVISFLAPATHRPSGEVEGFPRMNQRQGRNRPPAPAPPPPPKRR